MNFERQNDLRIDHAVMTSALQMGSAQNSPQMRFNGTKSDLNRRKFAASFRRKFHGRHQLSQKQAPNFVAFRVISSKRNQATDRGGNVPAVLLRTIEIAASGKSIHSHGRNTD